MDSALIQANDIRIELPAFKQLLSLDKEIKQRFPKDYGSGLAELGLILEKPSDWKNGGHWCTPLNTLSFGNTGTDGEHFSFLVLNSKITAQSPVIVTIPDGTDVDMSANVMLAKNFTNFLRLGLHHGFSSLVDLGFTPKAALPLYLSDYSPTKNRDGIFLEEALDDQGYEILDFVGEVLELQPYMYTVAEFILLQQRYMPLLAMPDDYDDPNVYG